MRKSLASGVGVAAALVVVFGSGSAAAVNEYKGMTYEQAAEEISAGGGTAVISTREGSYLPTEQCMVIGSRSAQGRILLDLNCNDTSALNGHPGNSVATPEGKQVQEARRTAEDISENYAAATAQGSESYCEQNADDCRGFCEGEGAGLCSAELMQFLGL